jgi:hypothetical protein
MLNSKYITAGLYKARWITVTHRSLLTDYILCVSECTIATVPHSITRLVVLTHTKCVICDVGAEFLAIIWMQFKLQSDNRFNCTCR